MMVDRWFFVQAAMPAGGQSRAGIVIDMEKRSDLLFSLYITIFEKFSGLSEGMDVFISYSRKDRNPDAPESDVILQIRKAFNENGISFWMDEDGIHSGETFASVISRNIAECKVFLFVSSAHSNSSRWTCGEIATANSYEKRIIPFRIDDTPYDPSVAIYLAALDAIDYTAGPGRAIRRLVKSVKRYLADLDAEAELVRIAEERSELEAKVRQLDARIDDLLKEKNQFLGEMTAIRSQIAGLKKVNGDEPEPMKPAAAAPAKRIIRWKKND